MIFFISCTLLKNNKVKNFIKKAALSERQSRLFTHKMSANPIIFTWTAPFLHGTAIEARKADLSKDIKGARGGNLTIHYLHHFTGPLSICSIVLNKIGLSPDKCNRLFYRIYAESFKKYGPPLIIRQSPYCKVIFRGDLCRCEDWFTKNRSIAQGFYLSILKLINGRPTRCQDSCKLPYAAFAKIIQWRFEALE